MENAPSSAKICGLAASRQACPGDDDTINICESALLQYSRELVRREGLVSEIGANVHQRLCRGVDGERANAWDGRTSGR
jgi:hypothetical protein